LLASKGSFDSISHDVNQPLNAAIQTGLGNVFSSTPLAILQPRTAIAWQFEPKSVLRAGFGIFSDILPGSIADVVGRQPALRQNISGRPSRNGRRHSHRSRSSEQRGRRNRGRQSNVQFRICAGPAFLRLRTGESCNVSFLRSPSRRCPDGKLHAPYFMEWSLGLEHELGTTGSITRNTSARAR
jgi:hypothetical protein